MSIKTLEAYVHQDSGEIACDSLAGKEKKYELVSLFEKCKDTFVVKVFDAEQNNCANFLV